MLARLSGCRRACTVGEIAACCPIDLSVVSRHLAALRDAGVISAEKRGREVYYRVEAASLAARLRALADAIDACPCADSTPPPASRRKH
jgi:DNA-binding transcriptional ArsR family regulator